MPNSAPVSSARALERLQPLKSELDRLRPSNARAIQALDDWNRVELTYSSNALEGNTLTRSETAIILEKGLTIGQGRTMREHLEAVNHGHAIDFVRQLVSGGNARSEMDLRQIQALIVAGDARAEPGRYSSAMRPVSGSKSRLPGPSDVGRQMREFSLWLFSEPASPETAVEAHSRLIEIHPFSDGNDRTARLLMNAVLWRGGYPPAVVEPSDRTAYLEALAQRRDGDKEHLRSFMLNCVLASAERYLDVVRKG